MWNRMKEKVASPNKKRGNQSQKQSSPFSTSPQNKSPKEEEKAKKNKPRVSWGIKAKKSAGESSDDVHNIEKPSKNEEVKNKTLAKAKNTNVDLEAARIVTIAMVHASLTVKKQQQKKNIRAEAKAIAWKSIANAAIELRCN